MSKYSQLLTDFHNRDGLFLPDSNIYGFDHTIQGTEIIAKMIFVWLGIKPVDVTYSNNYFNSDLKSKNIFIIFTRPDESVFINVALITKQCMEYYLIRKKVSVIEENVERALIDFGLGLLVINSFQSDKIISNIFTNKNKRLEILKSISKKEFSRRFNDYIKRNQFDTDIIIEHTLKSNRPYLEFKHTGRSKEKNESFIINEHIRQQKNMTKYILVFACLCASFVLVAFLYAQKPKGLPEEAIVQKNTINSLEQEYRNCISELKEKEQKYEIDDIYMVRQIQAQFNECTSIKNKYDYSVQQYNKLLDNI